MLLFSCNAQGELACEDESGGSGACCIRQGPSAPGLGEDSTLEPTNPYSAAKAGAEMMARAYLTSYRLPVITTRGNNVYGPHQFPEKMIPKFTLLASRGQDLPVHGDGARPPPSTAINLAQAGYRLGIWACGKLFPYADAAYLAFQHHRFPTVAILLSSFLV